MNTESKIVEPSGITQWQAIPDDFAFEVYLDRHGKPFTSKVSLTPLAQRCMAAGARLRWCEDAGSCFRRLFAKRYDIPVHKLHIFSDVRPDMTMDVWIYSSVPFPLKTLHGPTVRAEVEASRAPKLKQNRDSDCIDI